jgi:hypothetical protein
MQSPPLDSTDGVVDRVLASWATEIEAFQGMCAEAHQALRDALVANLTAFEFCMTEGDISAEMEEVFAQTGRRACRYGLPIDAVVSAYDKGYRIAKDELGGADLPRSGTGLGITAGVGSHKLLKLVARAAEIASDAYEETKQRLPQVEPPSTLMDALLSGALAESTHTLGTTYTTDLKPPYAVLAVVSEGAPGISLRSLGMVLPEAISSSTLWDPIPHRLVVAQLVAQRWDALSDWAKSAGVTLVAEAAEELTGVRSTYLGFHRRLPIAPNHGAGRIIRAIDLTGPWIASIPTSNERFADVRAVLGPILARRQDYARNDLMLLKVLMETNGDVRATASQIGISVDRAQKRLRAIASRCGLTLESPGDQMRLVWALLLHEDDPYSLPPPGDQRWAGSSITKLPPIQ